MTAKQFFIRLGIIIAITLLIIGWMGWQGYKLQKGWVLIVTDKTEYEKGGTLKVKIKNNFRENICFSSCYPYYLQGLRPTLHPPVEGGPLNKTWESYKYADCYGLDGNGDCIPAQKEKAFELILPEVPEGLHRLAIPVCIGCKSGDHFQEDKRFYSNEFTIK